MSASQTRPSEAEALKAPKTKVSYSEEELLELYLCSDDPLYFMREFVKVQHPLKGAVHPEHYEFQERLVGAFHENRFTIALTARQMGKCSTYETRIRAGEESISIGDLIQHITIRERLVGLLEKALVWLAKM